MIKKYLKSLKPLIYSLTLIFIIEISFFFFSNQKDLQDNINFTNSLALNFLEPENIADSTIFIKNNLLGKKNSEIVIIGDSTGLFNISPNEIMKLNPHQNVINLASYFLIDWLGFEKILLYNLRYNKKINTVILALTPHFITKKNTKSDNVILKKINDYYFSPWRFINQIPSIAYRENIVRKIFYDFKNIKFSDYSYSKYLLQNYKENKELNYDQLPEIKNKNQFILDYFQQNQGWIFLNNSSKSAKLNNVSCELYNFNEFFIAVDSIDSNLNKLLRFYKIAKKNNIKLMVIFSPIPCKITKKTLSYNEDLEKFKNLHPEISIPFPLFYNQPIVDFADDVHLLEDSAIIFSKKIAEEFIIK
jgi:hypothetical protein